MSYKILLVDDNTSTDFLKPLRETAFNVAKFDLDWRSTWEDSTKLLETNNGYYSGLILDGKGQKTATSKAEDDSFLDEAKEWLKEKARIGIYIPFVVYTGYADELKKYFGNLDIYWKDRGEEEDMLKKLLEKINNTELDRYKHRFPDLFASIGGKYLPEGAGPLLVNLLKWSEQDIVSKIWFNSLRDFIEEIFKRSNNIDNVHLLPDTFLNPVQQGRPNLKACALYWAGRQVDLTRIGGNGNIQAQYQILSPHNSWLADSTIQVSQILSHNYNDNFTIYAYRSCVSAVCELLIWFKQYIDNNYPHL
jgi:hypothetical protein